MKSTLAKEAGAGAVLLALLAGIAWFATRPPEPVAEPDLDCVDLVEIQNSKLGTAVFCASVADQMEGVLPAVGLVECSEKVKAQLHGNYPLLLEFTSDCTLVARAEGRITGATLLLLGRPIDLNSASQEDLTAIPGLGPKTARAIIAERGENGPFCPYSTLQTRVRGIGPKKASEFERYLESGNCGN